MEIIENFSTSSIGKEDRVGSTYLRSRSIFLSMIVNKICTGQSEVSYTSWEIVAEYNNNINTGSKAQQTELHSLWAKYPQK